MKKFALVISAFLALAFSGFAQGVAMEDLNQPELDAPQYGRRILVNKFSENWEISAHIGTQTYLGEYTIHQPVMKFNEIWSFPAFDFGIHKWATNSLGVSVSANFSPYKGLRYRYGDKYATFAKDSDPLYNDSFYLSRGSFGNVFLQAMINLSNAIGGYKASRFYTLVASIGGGIMFPTVQTYYREICASFNAGLNSKFRIASHLTLDVDIRGTLHDDMFNGISYYTSDDRPNLSVDATIGATVGLSYRFNWTKSKKKDAKGRPINDEGWTTVNDIVQATPDYQNLKEEAAAVTAAVAANTAALAAANEKLAEQEKIIKEQEVRIKEAKGRLIFKQYINFVIDTWDISNREKVNILFAADVMKQYPDTKFLIAGYADKQTATPEHNKMLSENRAAAVYDVLVNEFGVNPDQLQKADFGGVDYMFFHDEQCSRSVLITSLDGDQLVFETDPVIDPDVRYGIQIMSGRTTYGPEAKEFMGYEPYVFNVGSLKKYVIAVDNDFKNVFNTLPEIRKSYPGAFIVRIKGSTIELYK